MKTPRVVLDAFFPQVIEVGGLKLRDPFTIKHWLALEKIKSPFISETEEIPLLEAVKCLWICAQSSADVFAAAVDPQLEELAVELAGRIQLSDAAEIVRAVTLHINQGFGPKPVTPDAPGEEDGEGHGPFLGRLRQARAGSSTSSRKSARTRRNSTK